MPAAAGWKVVASLMSPPWKTTGLVVMSPAVVFELVTPTLNGPIPGFSSAEPPYVRMPGVRIAGSSVTEVADEVGVVEMLPWLGLMMKPDGWTVTAPVPML